ncbi:hypothetical protein [Phycicoccus sp. Root101]|uniref:SLAC1 family transporter n=1 Tax=Phycicoccus sp. Root101 TaxID=1736421 RepID=UPI00138F44F9|nr:hypothetical protein [Phycicoccus sp. Root101]
MRANVLGLPFGLVGLSLCWSWLAPPPLDPVTAFTWVVTVAAWLIVSVAYLLGVGGARRIRSEIDDEVLGPFTALLFIPLMPVGARLASHAPVPGRALVLASTVGAVAIGGWLNAGWVLGETDISKWHPGYLLPTVAAGLVSAGSLSAVGYPSAAMVMFGLGLVCWLFQGAVIFVRLVGHPPLPIPLRPTLAILVAPPAVAGNAWMNMNGNRLDSLALGFCGFMLLMVVTQARLVPPFLQVPFGPGWWSFSFSYIAAITFTARALIASHVGQPQWVAAAALTAVSSAVAALLVATVIAIARGTYFPPQGTAATAGLTDPGAGSAGAAAGGPAADHPRVR